MIGLIICFLLMLLLQIFTPFWWWIMIVPFVYSLLKAKSGWEGFRIGMFSAGLLWLIMSVYAYLTGSKTIAVRISQMFQLEIPWLMIAVTVLVAAIAAGISGMAGYSVKTLLRR
ncbi:MAG: hypothetical protein KAU91_06880 [Candidatus Aminicenantes bacterium]|nr:hypothetical protein [Candidatus Aminicenantes bacterium]